MKQQPPILVDTFIVADEDSHGSKERELQKEDERQL